MRYIGMNLQRIAEMMMSKKQIYLAKSMHVPFKVLFYNRGCV